MFGNRETPDPYIYLLATGIVFVAVALTSTLLDAGSAQWSWTAAPMGIALILFWLWKRSDRSTTDD